MKNEMQWERLTKLARQAQRSESTEAPYGFATCVAANWQSAEPVSLETVWEFLSLRSLALAAVVMVVSLGINYDLLSGDWSHELAMTDHAIQEVLEP
jgi:hypothetical protein